MKMSKFYKDDNGYFRFTSNDKLVHRYNAWRYLYKPNKDNFPLRFSQYVVHHIDGNKLNNHSNNLEILTEDEHGEEHPIHKGGILIGGRYPPLLFLAVSLVVFGFLFSRMFPITALFIVLGLLLLIKYFKG